MFCNPLLKFICRGIGIILILTLSSNVLVTSRSLEIEANFSEVEVRTKSVITETVYISKVYSELSKPVNVSWKLDGQYLEVSWLHSNLFRSIEGYYVSICAWQKGTCGPPEFVHFNKRAMKGRILGLAPDSKYIVKVIVYNTNEHKSSSAKVINTAKLVNLSNSPGTSAISGLTSSTIAQQQGFCQAHSVKCKNFLRAEGLTVSQITSSSAVFKWHHDGHNNIHDVRFKLHCDGLRQCLTPDREIIQQKYIIHHLSHSTSSGREVFLAENIASNSKYTCTISTVAGTIHSPASHTIEFSTGYGAPPIPPTPTLHVSQDRSFSASISPTSECNGPLSHYLLIAVPVVRPKDSSVTAAFTSVVPHNEILLRSLREQSVDVVKQPIPFLVSSIYPNDVPTTINFGYRWRHAFKPNHYYSVVLVAFTKTNNSQALYSTSDISNPPVYIGEDMIDVWIESRKPLAHQFTVVVVSCIVAVVVIFIIAFLLLFITTYYNAKRRDTKNNYMIVVSSSGSSDEEEEIYNRTKHKIRARMYQKVPNSQLSEARAPLSERSPDMTHAEWAIDNMSSRSPAFREMALKHPEALEDPVMTRIGKRWEEELQDSAESNPTLGKHKRETKPTRSHTVGGTKTTADAARVKGKRSHTTHPHL